MLAVDREWSPATKDIDKFAYYASDRQCMPGMPVVTRADKIKEAFAMAATPGVRVAVDGDQADVGGSGDLGYRQHA
jgi:hypothetical protein